MTSPVRKDRFTQPTKYSTPSYPYLRLMTATNATSVSAVIPTIAANTMKNAVGTTMELTSTVAILRTHEKYQLGESNGNQISA